MELPSGRRRVWSGFLNQACGMLIVWTLWLQFSQGLSVSLTQTGFSYVFISFFLSPSVSLFPSLGGHIRGPQRELGGALWRAQMTLCCQKGPGPCPHHWGHSAAADFGSAVDVGMEPHRHISPSQACPKHLLTHLTLKMLGEPLKKTAAHPHTSWPGMIVTTLLFLTTEVTVCYYTTGGSGKEHHQPEESGKCQKEKGDTSPYVLPTFQHPFHWNPSHW